MDFESIPPNAIYAKIYPYASEHFSWRIRLCRKDPHACGGRYTDTVIFGDYAYTFWGAKRAARKLYRKYRRDQKRKDVKATFIVFEVPK